MNAINNFVKTRKGRGFWHYGYRDNIIEYEKIKLDSFITLDKACARQSALACFKRRGEQSFGKLQEFRDKVKFS